jgi:hypothetical protein
MNTESPPSLGQAGIKPSNSGNGSDYSAAIWTHFTALKRSPTREAGSRTEPEPAKIPVNTGRNSVREAITGSGSELGVFTRATMHLVKWGYGCRTGFCRVGC